MQKNSVLRIFKKKFDEKGGENIKIENIVVGFLVLMFAIILAVDAILVTFGQPGIPLSGNDVKGITGVGFVLVAILIFIKARK
jgi:hypothetical protein